MSSATAPAGTRPDRYSRNRSGRSGSSPSASARSRTATWEAAHRGSMDTNVACGAASFAAAARFGIGCVADDHGPDERVTDLGGLCPQFLQRAGEVGEPPSGAQGHQLDPDRAAGVGVDHDDALVLSGFPEVQLQRAAGVACDQAAAGDRLRPVDVAERGVADRWQGAGLGQVGVADLDGPLGVGRAGRPRRTGERRRPGRRGPAGSRRGARAGARPGSRAGAGRSRGCRWPGW